MSGVLPLFYFYKKFLYNIYRKLKKTFKNKKEIKEKIKL